MATLDGILAQLVNHRNALREELEQVERMLAQARSKAGAQARSGTGQAGGEHVCNVCVPPKTFRTSGALGSHMLAVHGVEGASRRAQDRKRQRLRAAESKEGEQQPVETKPAEEQRGPESIETLYTKLGEER